MKNKPGYKPLKSTAANNLAILLFILYLALLIWLLFFGVGRQNRMPGHMGIGEYMRLNSNFHPFRTIQNYFHAFSIGTLNPYIFIVNIFGNIFAFAPMGIFLPILFRRFRRFLPFIGVMLTLLVGVELIQLITFTGSCDIDDVILNLFGAILFFGLFAGLKGEITHEK